jgi:hypothetical protein
VNGSKSQVPTSPPVAGGNATVVEDKGPCSGNQNISLCFDLIAREINRTDALLSEANKTIVGAAPSPTPSTIFKPDATSSIPTATSSQPQMLIARRRRKRSPPLVQVDNIKDDDVADILANESPPSSDDLDIGLDIATDPMRLGAELSRDEGVDPGMRADLENAMKVRLYTRV